MLAVEARFLSKTYTERRRAGHGVPRACCFSIPEGELAAIMGPSGVGKSTLLHLLAGIDRVPTAGSVTIFGQALDSLSGREIARLRNERIGFVFQFHHLLPEFTAEEKTSPSRTGSRACRPEKPGIGLPRCSPRVGLADRRGHLPGALSGGERARVAEWPGPWRGSQNSCWPTSRRAISTPIRRGRCSSCSWDCTASAPWRLSS